MCAEQTRTWTTVEPINARSMLEAATAAATTAAGGRPPVERRRRLSQAALNVTNQKVRPAYSPIVIAGVVRVIDFMLFNLVGVGIYLYYVMPLNGFRWEYVAAIIAMAVSTVICFQAADQLQRQFQDSFLGQGSVRQPVVEGNAGNVLRHEEVDVLLVAVIESHSDVRMVELRDRPSFRVKPLAGCFIRDCAWRQDLHCDIAIQ